MDQVALMIVGVQPAAALATRPRLFAALEAAFPVRFVRRRPDCDAVISFGDGLRAGDPPVPALLLGGESPGAPSGELVTINDHPSVDHRLQGLRLVATLTDGPPVPSGDTEVLAAAGSWPVWTCTHEPVTVHRLRAALPELAPGELLWSVLWSNPLPVVALVQFLRALSGSRAAQPPPLRAAFVFDDPNLRWRSYGYIDYARLVAHADANGYHAAMALIPLDARRPHRQTAALFRTRRDRVSLVIHGNDHVKRELFRARHDGAALALAAQAMRRIERFERSHGVRVDRIMMPPHGMCAENTAEALAAVGFDALCTIHPIPWTGTLPEGPPLVGWNPAGFVGGCAVLPRIHLSATDAEIALRAFLDHPLVLYGHHDDVAGGLEPLAAAAARVNRLGDVRWAPLEEIALANRDTRVTRERLIVRPYARRVRVTVREPVTNVGVPSPHVIGGRLGFTGWSLDGGPVRPFDAAVAAEAGAHEVRLHGERTVNPAHVAAPVARPWPLMRRAATELRDRALPLRPVRAR